MYGLVMMLSISRLTTSTCFNFSDHTHHVSIHTAQSFFGRNTRMIPIQTAFFVIRINFLDTKWFLLASLGFELCDRCVNDYAKQELAACNLGTNYTKLMYV